MACGKPSRALTNVVKKHRLPHGRGAVVSFRTATVRESVPFLFFQHRLAVQRRRVAPALIETFKS